jgi:hypothetical protein
MQTFPPDSFQRFKTPLTLLPERDTKAKLRSGTTISATTTGPAVVSVEGPLVPDSFVRIGEKFSVGGFPELCASFCTAFLTPNLRLPTELLSEEHQIRMTIATFIQAKAECLEIWPLFIRPPFANNLKTSTSSFIGWLALKLNDLYVPLFPTNQNQW